LCKILDVHWSTSAGQLISKELNLDDDDGVGIYGNCKSDDDGGGDDDDGNGIYSDCNNYCTLCS